MVEKRSLASKLALGFLALLTGLALLVLLGFSFPQKILCVESGEVRADALVVLGGGGLSDRALRAAELYRSGAAPVIIVSGRGDCTNQLRVLEAHGVAPIAIVMECDSRTTQENAEFSIALLRARGAKSAIIVTSWYHSRRALRCFRHYGSGLQFYSRPSYANYDRLSWPGASGWHYVRLEYVKLLGYWVTHRVCPF